jgi:hypothetical protein
MQLVKCVLKPEAFATLRTHISVRHEPPMQGKVGHSQDHWNLLGYYVKGVPDFPLLRTWL